MMASIRDWLERISIRKRLIVMTFLIALFSVALVVGTLGAYTSRVLSGEATSARAQLARFSASSISERLQEALRVAKLTIGQKLVSDIFDRTASGGVYPLAEQIADAADLSNFLSQLETGSDFVRVRLLLCGDTIYSNEQINFFRMSDAERAEMEALRHVGQYYAVTEGEFPYIFQNSQRVVTLTYTKAGSMNYMGVAGAVAVDIATEDILGRMRNMLITPGDAVTLYGYDGEPILYVGDELLAALPALNGVTNAWTQSDDPNVMYFETRLAVGGWYLSYRVNTHTMYSQVTDLMRIIAVVLSLTLVLAFAMTITTSAANSRRILRLSEAMDRVRSGDMDARVQEGSENEVGVMEHSFNYLLDELKHMLDAKVESARQMQNLEMRLLQSQIKPHFLYNTLDLICWRLNMSGDEKGARYVQALAQFYRIGLSRGSELIPLREELRHVQLYVEIQNFRLDGSIELVIAMSQDLGDIPVPGNILQPLVENSIGAGILEKPEGRGRVAISCERTGDMLVILISDDGVGMDMERIRQLLSQRSDSHYGVWNVHKRLLLLYGEDAGLAYSHNDAGGVDVRVRIPFRRLFSEY